MDVQPMPRVMETERLLLRSWTGGDAAELRDLWGERDPRSARRISEDGHPTVEEMRERLRAELAASESNGIRLYAVEHATEGMLGYCGLVLGRATATEPELAFELLHGVHGHGFATEAAGAVVDASDASGRVRLWSTAREWNTASLHVLAKLGFDRTGCSETDLERGALLWLARSRPEGGVLRR